MSDHEIGALVTLIVIGSAALALLISAALAFLIGVWRSR
jgi:hypothetical protein